MTLDLGVHAPDPDTADGWDRLESMATALADAVDAKGRYKPSHCHGVARIAVTIAATLGVRGPALQRLRLAGLLHDVGKLQTPDAILLKPDQLEVQEYEVIKLHSVSGHSMLVALGLHDEARWVLHHHERADGTGYPSGLTGRAIPLGSRILQVADAYDCMTTNRVYAVRRPTSWALGELQEHVDDQFDQQVVAALAEALSRTRSTRAS